MPVVSERGLARIQNTVASLKKSKATAIKRARTVSEKSRIKNAGYAMAGAAAMGFVRGKMEDPDGTWNLFDVVDGELLVGAGLLAGGLFLSQKASAPKEAAEALTGMGAGALSHYLGQVARKYAKTGEYSMVAGHSDYSLVGGAAPASNDAIRSALSTF